MPICSGTCGVLRTGPLGKFLSPSSKQVSFLSRTLTTGRVLGLLTSLGSVEKEMLLSVGECPPWKPRFWWWSREGLGLNGSQGVLNSSLRSCFPLPFLILASLSNLSASVWVTLSDGHPSPWPGRLPAGVAGTASRKQTTPWEWRCVAAFLHSRPEAPGSWNGSGACPLAPALLCPLVSRGDEQRNAYPWWFEGSWLANWSSKGPRGYWCCPHFLLEHQHPLGSQRSSGLIMQNLLDLWTRLGLHVLVCTLDSFIKEIRDKNIIVLLTGYHQTPLLWTGSSLGFLAWLGYLL